MEKPYFLQLKENLIKEYKTYKCCPNAEDIFRVFKLCNLEDIRVVVCLQDPYPYGNHADGVALSSKQTDTPHSLRIVLREVDRDVVKTRDKMEFKQLFPTNELSKWVKQGVFMLNTVLTVRANSPQSHAQIGWQQFTSNVLNLIFEQQTPKVFVAWGSDAQQAIKPLFKTNSHHLYLEAGHPASGAHGKDKFSGCNHFSKINYYFWKQNLPEIDWTLK